MAFGRLPGQEHPDLAVVDLTRSPGGPALDAHALFALLDKARLVDGQHGVLCSQAAKHHAGLFVAQGVRIPRATSEQVLEAIRPVQARRFRPRPTVFALHAAGQALQICACGRPRRWVGKVASQALRRLLPKRREAAAPSSRTGPLA